mmetsp:Transcript_50821/g.83567  ORF Transcript_50821/g.83567 Transcript_50821/m.83567 type:complete len:381 (-) Transcript_50821:221-1363(-)
MHRSLHSSPGFLQSLSDTIHGVLLLGKFRFLLLGPVLQVLLHVLAGLFVLLVPGIEGLLSIRLVLEDAQQVAVAKGIDGLRLVELLCCAPAVLELTFNDSRLLSQVHQHLLIQGSHWGVHVLGQLLPDLLHDVRLGLAWHVLLRSEELLQTFHILLHLRALLVVAGHQLPSLLPPHLIQLALRLAFLLSRNAAGGGLQVIDQLAGKRHGKVLTSRWDLETIQHLLDLGRLCWGRGILHSFLHSLQLLDVVSVVLTLIGKQIHFLQRSRVGGDFVLVFSKLHLVRGKGPAAVCIAVHFDDCALEAEVIGHLVGLLLKGVIVGSLHGNVLLVVLPLVVEELLQDFSEGLNLVLGHALLELIAGPELLVELVLSLLQQECLIF